MLSKVFASALLPVLILSAGPSFAAERVIPGAAAQYARSFQDVTAALYRWASANPDATTTPTVPDVMPYAFTPWGADGFEIRLSQPVAGSIRICMLARLTTPTQLGGFETASQRSQAQLSRSADCTADAGQEARAGLPVRTAMARTVELARIAMPPVLPAQPAVAVTGQGPLDFTNAAPSVTIQVTNNTLMPLGLLEATVPDARFTVGSDCQIALDPSVSCQVQVLMQPGLQRKTISRLTMKFSNGSTATVSLRGNP